MANPTTVNRLFDLLKADNHVAWGFNDEGEAAVTVTANGDHFDNEYVSTTYRRIIHCKNKILQELGTDSFLLQIEGYQIGGLSITNSFLARLNTPVSFGKDTPIRVPKVRKPEFEIIFKAVESLMSGPKKSCIIEGQLQLDIVKGAA